MKKSIKLLSVLVVLLLAVVVLPVTGFADEQTVQAAPVAPRRYAAATDNFADHVDENALMAYLKAQMQACATEIDITAYGVPADGEYLSQIGGYIINNMAELFHFEWFGPYYTGNGVITKISVDYSDFADTVGEYNACVSEFNKVATRLLDGIKGNTYLTDVEKALLLHDRLIVWTEYDKARLNNGTMPDISYTAYGILVKQLGVCQGYALAYDYLLEQVGIRCEYVSSELLNHAWNIVYINNKPYHVDTTWDDPTWDITGRVNHDNFLRSSNGIKATGHAVNGVVDYTTTPTDTTYDNYYWQNSNTAFQYVGGWIFYIDNVSQQLNYLNNGTANKLVSVDATWRATSNSTWRGNFSRLSSDSSTLFFSKPDGIYRYHPSSGLVEKVYSPNLSGGNYFAVYGFKYERGYLICDLSDTPNFTQYTKNNQVKYMFAQELDDGWQFVGGKWHYYINNNPTTGWVKDKNIWYYFDTSGVMQTGWKQIGGAWYYFDPSGAMATGWCKVGGMYYYFNSAGVMQTGWKQIGGVWYYFNTSGEMATGWRKLGGAWYYFNSSGSMATGWVKLGGVWYYLNSFGAMQTGWLQQGSTWYYLKSSGAMATGWLQQGSTWYYFNSSGAMATGWCQIGGTYYYFNASGAMVTGWVKSGNLWYYMNSSGAMVTGWLKSGSTWYYFSSSGAMYTGWLQLGGKWYAFTDSGAMITGWGYDVYGNYYYFNSDGSMVTGRKYIDGYWYTFNSNGVCQDL